MIFPTIISDATNHLENKNHPDFFSFVHLPSSLQFSSSGALWKTTFMAASALRGIICFVCGRLPVCIFRGERQTRNGALSGNSSLLARRGLPLRNHSRCKNKSIVWCVVHEMITSKVTLLFCLLGFHFTYISSSHCRSRSSSSARHMMHVLTCTFALDLMELK